MKTEERVYTVTTVCYNKDMNNTALNTEMVPDNLLWSELTNIREAWMRGDLSQTDGALVTPFGQLHYRNDVDEEDNEYLLVQFLLPAGVMAEIDGQTFGDLKGFRIYE